MCFKSVFHADLERRGNVLISLYFKYSFKLTDFAFHCDLILHSIYFATFTF